MVVRKIRLACLTIHNYEIDDHFRDSSEMIRILITMILMQLSKMKLACSKTWHNSNIILVMSPGEEYWHSRKTCDAHFRYLVCQFAIEQKEFYP